MTTRWPGQEQFVCKGEGFAQASLAHGQVDKQSLGRLEVSALPGETTSFEERLSCARQRMSIRQR